MRGLRSMNPGANQRSADPSTITGVTPLVADRFAHRIAEAAMHAATLVGRWDWAAAGLLVELAIGLPLALSSTAQVLPLLDPELPAVAVRGLVDLLLCVEDRLLRRGELRVRPGRDGGGGQHDRGRIVGEQDGHDRADHIDQQEQPLRRSLRMFDRERGHPVEQSFAARELALMKPGAVTG